MELSTIETCKEDVWRLSQRTTKHDYFGFHYFDGNLLYHPTIVSVKLKEVYILKTN